jgi:hypothetical protein
MENENSPKSQSGDKKHAKYYCKQCDFGTDNKKDFKRHTESKKHNDKGGKPLKEEQTAETKAFFCMTCYYGTDNRKDYKRHLESIKHMKAEDEEDQQVKEMVEKLRLKKEREEAEYIESTTAKCVRGCRYKKGERGWDFDGLKGNWLCDKCDEEECKMLFGGLRNTIVA